MTSQFTQIRSDPARFGEFDPDRIVVFGVGDEAFPGALIAFDNRLEAGSATGGSPVCAAVFIDGLNFDTRSPDSRLAREKFAEEPSAESMSPLRLSANAPPTLLMTEALDKTSAGRSDRLAAAIRAQGGIAVRSTYPRFESSDPTTYLGYVENPSTKVIAHFLRTHCPAARPPAAD